MSDIVAPIDQLKAMLRTTRGLAQLIAAECGISREAVWAWRKVPAVRAIGVERVTGIPRSVLRPDIYPPNESSSVRQ